MKKVLSLVLALVLVLFSTAAMADELYHGFGSVTGAKSSKNASADANGTAQVDTTMASVVVDENGVIISVHFDVQQTKINFNANGEIVTDVTAAFATKVELKDGYNMRGTSEAMGIGKEYFEQIDGLEQWLVGKTVADFKAAVEGKDETLLAVCTIKVGDHIAALEKAVADALSK